MNNDEPKTDKIKNDYSGLSSPEYAEESAKYVLSSNPEGIESIELTESGEYILSYANNYSPYAIKAGESKSAVDRIFEKTLSSSFSRSVSTRSGYGMEYGKYRKLGNGEYYLEGFGTVTVMGDTLNAIELVVSPEDGDSFTVGAQIEKAYSLSDQATAALCRSWEASNWHVKYIINGKVASDREDYYYNCNEMLREVSKDIYNYLAGIYKDMYDDDDYDDDDYDDDDFDYDEDYDGSDFEEMDYPLSVVFTKSGSYLVEFSNSNLDIRQWKWTNVDKRELLYSYYLEDDIDGYGTKATVTFTSNKAVIYTRNVTTDEGLRIEFQGWETLTEKY